MEFGKVINQGILIEPTVNYGFIVSIGCARFSYASKEAMLKDLEEYLGNPDALEKAYYTKGADVCLDGGECATPTASVFDRQG